MKRRTKYHHDFIINGNPCSLIGLSINIVLYRHPFAERS